MAKFFKPNAQSRSKSNKPRKHKSQSKQMPDFVSTVVDYDHEAKGIAKHESGRIVFVPGVLKNETVKVRPTTYTDSVIKAEVLDIISPSAERVAPKCEHFDHCGGCQLQYMEDSQQVTIKQEALSSLLSKRLDLKDIPWQPALADSAFHYRRTARLSVWYESNKLSIGFRQNKSKQIIDVINCPILVPELSALVQALRPVLANLSNPKAVTHIQLFYVESGSHVILRSVAKLTSSDKQRLAEAIHGREATVMLEPEKHQYEILSNSDKQAEKLLIKDASNSNDVSMHYQIGDFALNFQPQDFIQVNAKVNQAMVEQALDWLNLQPNDTVLDLFCGIGNFTLPLAQRVKQVFAVEGVTSMVQRLQQNAANNELTNIRAYQADLSAIEPKTKPKWLTKVDKMLLDPARDGAFDVVKKIPLFAPKQILYVSCNPATMMRDMKELLNSGYSLTKMGLLNMFPQTSHVEAMALLELKK